MELPNDPHLGGWMHRIVKQQVGLQNSLSANRGHRDIVFIYGH